MCPAKRGDAVRYPAPQVPPIPLTPLTWSLRSSMAASCDDITVHGLCGWVQHVQGPNQVLSDVRQTMLSSMLNGLVFIRRSGSRSMHALRVCTER
jgi:hypothetical protein